MQINQIDSTNYTSKVLNNSNSISYSTVSLKDSFEITNRKKSRETVSFKGISIESIKEAGRKALDFVAGDKESDEKEECPDITKKFQEELKNTRQKYTDKKNEIKGWFKNGKIKKVKEKEDIELSRLLKDQEIFAEEQDKIIELFESQLKLMVETGASEKDKIALEKELARQKAIKVKMEEIGTTKNKECNFSTIGGYKNEKFTLRDEFIKYLAQERAGEDVESELANGILFFGPVGNGKTSFAEAFANEANCLYEEIIPKGKTAKECQLNFWKQLNEKAQKAQENFTKNNARIRTIILVDEFDLVANKDSVILSDLKDFMQDCSKDYHVTLFATTNNPLDIVPAIRGPIRMPIKVSIDPPDDVNSIEVFKHYLKDKDTEVIDYEVLAKKILSVKPNKAYNNSQIETICNNAYLEADGKITTHELCRQIDLEDPGIEKDKLLKFEQEKAQLIAGGTENE
ncbi:MAG: AAA family ATPase [Candidatus Gastranaerophilales bacterium]|nr:AAA family ATPase [Candidatus Gastranaerophilales bacterium]